MWLRLPDVFPRPLDLTKIADRQEALRWVASRVKHRHARKPFDPLHEVVLDPTSVRLRVFRGQYSGTQVRLDGFCLTCERADEARFSPAFIHQDNLLTWDGSQYVGWEQFSRLTSRKLLPDGSSRAEAEALRRLCRLRTPTVPSRGTTAS